MKYTKYDASGNTFVIFHTNKRDDYTKLAISLCEKERVDGLIVIIPHMVYDFEWLFYNKDGSTASMCGNGTRAVAHYAYDNKIAGKFMKFLTEAGEISCTVKGDVVQTTMTQPKVIKDIFEENDLSWWLVDTGVPHLVTNVSNIDDFDFETCHTMRYRYDANVNFTSLTDGKLFVRTYERGVEGETLACGTGMVASFLHLRNLQLIGDMITVIPKSGEKLTISIEKDMLYFKGKVTKIGDGSV